MFSSHVWISYLALFVPPHNCSTECTTEAFIGLVLTPQDESHRFIFGDESSVRSCDSVSEHCSLPWCNILCVKT